MLTVRVGSILGSDDLLLAFGADVGFAHDGWFSKKRDTGFPNIVDMIFNSGMFIFFGSIIPWDSFVPSKITPACGVWELILFLVLVILFRRIPIVLALKRLIPDIRAYQKALFCGHFGPVGVGALFLAIEARAQLETGTSHPLSKQKAAVPPYSRRRRLCTLFWPVICFVVLGSTVVHD